LSGFGAKAYVKLGVQTDVLNADPHRLVLILFDGALYAIQRAKGFLAAGRIAEKCQALSQACEIVDNGLRVSVDPSHDRQFANRLISLYKYVTMRLLQANLRNDEKALDEAAKILGGLRGCVGADRPAQRRRAGRGTDQRGEFSSTPSGPCSRACAACSKRLSAVSWTPGTWQPWLKKKMHRRRVDRTALCPI
jgi:flagellar secretion chaperone FliS